MTCQHVVKSIEQNKIIAIVRGVDKADLIPLANALYEGGIRLLEITYSANGTVSDQDTAECIKMLVEKPELVTLLQNNLYETVKDTYSLDTVCESRAKAYLELVGRSFKEFWRKLIKRRISERSIWRREL